MAATNTFDLIRFHATLVTKPVRPGVLLSPGHPGAKGIVIAPLVNLCTEIDNNAFIKFGDPAVADGGPHVAQVVGELVVLVAKVAAVLVKPPRQPDGADLSVVFDIVKVGKNATLSSKTVLRMERKMAFETHV